MCCNLQIRNPFIPRASLWIYVEWRVWLNPFNTTLQRSTSHCGLGGGDLGPGFFVSLGPEKNANKTKTYGEPCQTYKMEVLRKLFTAFSRKSFSQKAPSQVFDGFWIRICSILNSFPGEIISQINLK